MYPIGAKVTVVSVEHLGRFRGPKRLIGRTGTVSGHIEGEMHEVRDLVRTNTTFLFPAEAITPA